MKKALGLRSSASPRVSAAPGVAAGRHRPAPPGHRRGAHAGADTRVRAGRRQDPHENE
uniref:Uncharacterized protein n=1 Tax=Arundo donax TaxID=35708 RepID=A0A0A8ZW07_ARUDO